MQAGEEAHDCRSEDVHISAALMAAAPASRSNGDGNGLHTQVLPEVAVGGLLQPDTGAEGLQQISSPEVDPIIDEPNEPLSQESNFCEQASEDSVWRDVLAGDAAIAGTSHASQGSESRESHGPSSQELAASQESVTEMLLRSYEEPLDSSQQ